MALAIPGLPLLFLRGDGSFTSDWQPIVGNWTVSAFSGMIFSYPFGGGEPTGSYTWYAAFTQPATLNFIRPIAVAPFSFGL